MKHKQYNLEKIKDIAQGDQAFIEDMLVTFVENVSDDVEKIKSLRLQEDWKAIAEIAHRLASRFAYLNADSLYALSADIEESVLSEHNLTGIAEKADMLCALSVSMIEELRKDFTIFITKN